MKKLDVVKAAFAGFGVIGRNPLAILVWALFIGVVGILPAGLLMSGFIGSIIKMAAADTAGTEPTPEMIMPMLGSIFAIIPVLMLTGLIVRVVMTGAVFRAVLFPKDSGWFYLRLGARELWLALLSIVVGIIVFVIMMAMMALVVPTVLVTSGNHTDPMAQMLLIRAMMLPVYGVMAFLFMRFGLAFPQTFAESGFRLVESWSLTRGNGWRMLLMLLLLIALGIAAEMVLVLLILAVVFAVIGAGAMKGGWSEERLTAFFAQDPSVWMHALLPWIVGGSIMICILAAVVTAVFTAPLADAYRQLRADPDPVV